MEYSDACIKLAELIRADYYEYAEQAGLAIQTLNRAIDDGEDPAMALALAKNLDIESGLDVGA